MFCSKCGKQLNDGAAFCDSCGTAVNKSSQPESAGVQRAKAVSNEKILIERSQKNKAMTVIAIVSSLELLFLCLAGATKLSFFDFMFNSTGNSLLEYILDKSGGVLSFFGFMEGCCCLAEIIMCFVFYKKREFSTYKKFKLITFISMSILILIDGIVFSKYLAALGWLMVIMFIVANIISLVSVFKAAKAESEAIYFENNTYSKGRLHDKLSALRDDENNKGNMWECEECGTLNPSTQNFCKDCGKYR